MSKMCDDCNKVTYGDTLECAYCKSTNIYRITQDDPINHPKHYNTGKIEVIDFIEDQELDFRAGNVVKYVCRYKHKNGLEDLKKARWYLDRLIKESEV